MIIVPSVSFLRSCQIPKKKKEKLSFNFIEYTKDYLSTAILISQVSESEKTNSTGRVKHICLTGRRLVDVKFKSPMIQQETSHHERRT